MLGMRRAGYDVMALDGALVSEEVNTGPAKERMHRAGIADVSLEQAQAFLEASAALPAAAPAASPVIVRPLEMGFLLNDVAGLGAADPNSAAKLVRLRELLLISEWFKRPVLAQDPAATLAALPPNLRSVLTRPLLPLSSRPSTVTQLGIAGGAAGLTETARVLTGDVFVLEDTLVGAPRAVLDGLYGAGVVPTTYKSMYYELTVSVDDRQWPSHQWVIDSDPYFDLTKAPEELPPPRPESLTHIAPWCDRGAARRRFRTASLDA
jgi:hypothetical protein